ncbi:hypothetical protein LINPERPRIM_LOCUS22827 [Linum perenne]
MAGDSSEGVRGESGARADYFAEEDAGERDGAADQEIAEDSPQELREASSSSQEPASPC